MNIIDRFYEQAKNVQGWICLPEALLDNRVMEACKILVDEKLSNVVLVGEEDKFPAEFINNPNVKIVNPNSYSRKSQMIEILMEKRKNKGMTYEDAEKWLQDIRYFSTMLLEMHEADGMVLGAYYSSADALRPALQIVKAKQGSLVTGSMLMCREDRKEPLLFLDVSLNENPNAEELSQIGIEGAKFYEQVVGEKAKVAFLSYSTYGSANSDMVTKVRDAVNIAKTSKYIVDGEMQFDSATVPSVAKIKCPNSTIKGDANVLVFPDLNAGNIGYKIAQRLGGFEAVGPIMLNFRYPVNDLSRGCSTKDIVDTVVITKLQIER